MLLGLLVIVVVVVVSSSSSGDASSLLSTSNQGLLAFTLLQATNTNGDSHFIPMPFYTIET